MADRAKLFTHGGSQAVRLPKAYRFEGKEVSIRKEGDQVILERCPAPVRDWDEFWKEIDSLMQGEELQIPEREPAEDPDIEW